MAAVSVPPTTPTSARWTSWFNSKSQPSQLSARPVLTSRQHPRPYNSNNNPSYIPNGNPAVAPSAAPPVMAASGAAPLLANNNGRIIQNDKTRVLCVADVRGNLTSLNELAKSANADFILHTGDFGFYDDLSLNRIADKTLKHVAMYSPLLSEDMRRTITNAPSLAQLKEQVPRNQLPLSQLPQFLSGTLKFDVPVYTVWGACEDVQVLEKLRSGEYKINNLHVLDESHSRLLEVGGVKLRLLGLGGAVVMHKLFDNGEGRTTIAGGQGTMWTTLLQMGELVDTANRTYDPSETRVFVTHASPAREGLLNQLAVALKADFSISGGLHFRYGSSYNEFSVNPTLDHFRGKLAASKASFQDVWETVKQEVEPIVSENEAHQRLLNNALEVVEKMPTVANGSNPFGGHTGPSTGQIDEAAFKNMWNFNLADAAFGYLVLDVEGGRIGTEMKALGFNFAHRAMKNAQHISESIKSTTAVPTTVAAPTASQPPEQPFSQAAPQQVPPPAAAPQGFPPQRPTQPQRQSDVRQQAPPQSRPAQSATPQSTQPVQTSRTPAPTATATTTAAAAAAPAATATPVTATNGTDAAAETTTNGVASPTPATDAPVKSTPPPAREPREPPEKSRSIFIQHVETEEGARKLFSEENQAKIVSVERKGRDKQQWAVFFETPEIMEAVLKAAPRELVGKVEQGKPRMQINRPFPPRGDFHQAGYRSGGASDSEGGMRGRGGFRGGRSRGGAERGEHAGRGRGRGSGRGFNKDGPSAPSASTPATGAAGSS